MDHYDPQKTARVWQRVQSTGQPQQNFCDLPALIEHVRSDAAAYLQLSKKFSGKNSAMLRRMYEQELSHAACLKGIYALSTGKKLPSQPIKPPREATEIILRRCYGREMQCLAQCEARASDPQFGQTFARLARQEQEHARLLLELLGK